MLRRMNLRGMMITDYQKFTKKNMPMKKRRQLDIGDIFSNSAICLVCGEEIRSKNRHDHATCKCGNLSVDGGSWYLRRGFKKRNSYKNTVEYYDEIEE